MYTNSIRQNEKYAEKYWYTEEIRQMMYAFGDNQFPLHSSAYLIEDIVKEQLHHILCKAVEVCDLRGTKVIQLEELIFLMRKNRVKIHRLLRYLRVKDMKNVNEESVNVDAESVPLEGLKQKNTEYQTCLSFLKKIDNTGELTDMNYQPFDKIMYERNMRADKTAQILDEANYMIFTQARRASFVHSKNAEKFTDWLQSFWKSPESPKIHAKSNIILGYLSKETVAEIVDLAMLVRNDASVNLVEPLGRGFSRSSPGTSADSASNQLVSMNPPITPDEIMEAMRRFWFQQTSPWDSTNSKKFRILAF